MYRYRVVCAIVLAAVALALGINRDFAQEGQRRQQPRREQGSEQQQPVPSDPRILELHEKFVKDAEQLARDYIRDKRFDEAAGVFQEILRVVPGYPPAEQALEEYRSKLATAQTKTLNVLANRTWQDTGINAIAGRPLHIIASGQWVFRMDYELSADGIPIPEELRDFNLGALVGVIDTGDPETSKPFLIGADKQLVPDRNGRLYLQMYDADLADNQGKIVVEILGTFEEP